MNNKDSKHDNVDTNLWSYTDSEFQSIFAQRIPFIDSSCLGSELAERAHSYPGALPPKFHPFYPRPQDLGKVDEWSFAPVNKNKCVSNNIGVKTEPHPSMKDENWNDSSFCPRFEPIADFNIYPNHTSFITSSNQDTLNRMAYCQSPCQSVHSYVHEEKEEYEDNSDNDYEGGANEEQNRNDEVDIDTHSGITVKQEMEHMYSLNTYAKPILSSRNTRCVSKRKRTHQHERDNEDFKKNLKLSCLSSSSNVPTGSSVATTSSATSTMSTTEAFIRLAGHLPSSFDAVSVGSQKCQFLPQLIQRIGKSAKPVPNIRTQYSVSYCHKGAATEEVLDSDTIHFQVSQGHRLFQSRRRAKLEWLCATFSRPDGTVVAKMKFGKSPRDAAFNSFNLAWDILSHTIILQAKFPTLHEQKKKKSVRRYKKLDNKPRKYQRSYSVSFTAAAADGYELVIWGKRKKMRFFKQPNR